MKRDGKVMMSGGWVNVVVGPRLVMMWVLFAGARLEESAYQLLWVYFLCRWVYTGWLGRTFADEPRVRVWVLWGMACPVWGVIWWILLMGTRKAEWGLLVFLGVYLIWVVVVEYFNLCSAGECEENRVE